MSKTDIPESLGYAEGDKLARLDVSSRYNPLCEVVEESPACTHASGNAQEWRLRADQLENKKMSQEQLEGLRHRSSRHLNRSATQGVMGCVPCEESSPFWCALFW